MPEPLPSSPEQNSQHERLVELGQDFQSTNKAILQLRRDFIEKAMAVQGYNIDDLSKHDIYGYIAEDCNDFENQQIKQALLAYDQPMHYLRWNKPENQQDAWLNIVRPTAIVHVEHFKDSDQANSLPIMRRIIYYLKDGVIHKQFENYNPNNPPANASERLDRIQVREQRFEVEKAAGIQDIALNDEEASELNTALGYLKNNLALAYEENTSWRDYGSDKGQFN